MPMNAIRYDSVDAILPIKTIAATLTRLARGMAVEW
jgi:chemotaxis response regulator CheB